MWQTIQTIQFAVNCPSWVGRSAWNITSQFAFATKKSGSIKEERVINATIVKLVASESELDALCVLPNRTDTVG
jgi:hypothetical protein